MTATTISVTVQNNSAETLYIALNRADGPWLEALSGTPAWNKAPKSIAACNQEIAAGDSFSFKFPQYDSGVGCRMYVAETVITEAPDLATADFIYDKVEMGWNAIWNLTNVDFLAIPMQLSSGGVAVGYRSDVSREDMMGFLDAMPTPYNGFKKSHKGKTLRFFAPLKSGSKNC